MRVFQFQTKSYGTPVHFGIWWDNLIDPTRVNDSIVQHNVVHKHQEGAGASDPKYEA